MYLIVNPLTFLISSLHFADDLREVYNFCQNLLDGAIVGDKDFANLAMDFVTFDNKIERSTRSTRSIHGSNPCGIKLFEKSHMNGDSIKVTHKKERIVDGYSVKSLLTIGHSDCCWKIMRYLYILF